MTSGPPFDEDAERAVLGCVLLSNRALDPVLDMGLRSEHFHRPTYAGLWGATMNLRMREHAVDEITLTAEAERIGVKAPGGMSLRVFIGALATTVPSAGNFREYAQRTLELAEWRRRLGASRLMQEASLELSQEKWSMAQRLLDERVQRSKESLTADQWAEVLTT